MAEALPPGRPAALVLEIPEESDEQDLEAVASTRISWLHRLGAPAGDPSALAAEAAEVELPPGRGHAYLFGEATVVSRLREVLAGRGLGQDQMSPKAYWGRGRANASHGEPARDALAGGGGKERDENGGEPPPVHADWAPGKRSPEPVPW